jgi:hypothetical protein
MRGQAHTLEAFVAGLLILGGLVFALQTTAVTPLSASTSNQHVGNQQRAAAVGVLDAAEANGTLRDAVVRWNTTGGQFEGSDNGTYKNAGPPNAFGRALNETFGEQRTAFNVRLRWFGENRSEVNTGLMIDMGEPTDDAVVASRTVVLYNDTRLTGGSSGSLADAYANGTFYAPDVARGDRLFNVMEVRIVVWRI